VNAKIIAEVIEYEVYEGIRIRAEINYETKEYKIMPKKDERFIFICLNGNLDESLKKQAEIALTIEYILSDIKARFKGV
jgi:hypothetical protein